MSAIGALDIDAIRGSSYFLRPFVAPGDRAKLEYAERELSRPERAQAEHPDLDVMTDVRAHVLRRAEIRAEEATA